MKGFSLQKGNRKLVFLARTLRLNLKTLTPKKELHILTFGKVMRHAILFLQHIPVLFRNVTCVIFFLRPGVDKFRVNNVISCPASYIYYSIKHNDAVEDYLDWTDNGLFVRNTVGKVLVMRMLRFQLSPD